MIKLKNLFKTYHLKSGDVRALRDVNLVVNEGDIYGIIGYSGAGKSTLIRCINLLEVPNSGEIYVNNEQLTTTLITKEKLKKKERLSGIEPADKYILSQLKEKKLNQVRKGIGMIFQHFNLLDRSTVYENVAYALKYSKRSKEEIRNRVFELLDLVDLSDKVNVYPSQLSGGQKQRVAIARALANNPKVLLSDEATSSLDPESTESILGLLKKLNQQLGLTIVLITHEMSVVKTICNKVSVMDDGVIVEEGNVYDIFANPVEDVTKKFVGTTSSLHKIKGMMEENSPLIATGSNGKLIKLIYQKNSVGDALISEASRKYQIDVSIVLANVEILQDSPLGGMIALCKGEEQQISAAIDYFKANEVQVEVLNHGRVY